MILKVAARLNKLSEVVKVHVLTADLFGKAQQELKDVNCEVHILSGENHDVLFFGRSIRYRELRHLLHSFSFDCSNHIGFSRPPSLSFVKTMRCGPARLKDGDVRGRTRRKVRGDQMKRYDENHTKITKDALS